MLTSDYSPSPEELLEVLSRRGPLVDFLAESPRTKQDLRRELELPKSTMYKALRELEGLGMVERADEDYRLTQFGRVVLEKYRETHQSLDLMCTGISLLLSVSPDHAIHPSLFRDAELYLVEPQAPDGPINKFEALIRNADELKGFAPVTRERYVRMFYELFDADAIEAEIIIDTSVYEYVLENFQDRFAEEVAADVSTFRLLEEQFPFGLSILDGPDPCIVMNYYDANHNLLGIVVSRNCRVREWARAVFEAYRERSTEITPDRLA